MIFDELRIQEVKETLARFVDQGRLDRAVIDLLRKGLHFAPIECEILDFKREATDDRLGCGKTVLQIVSFHNSYGGYLLYGIDETASETEFTALGIAVNSIDVKQLKDKIKAYTGASIALSLQYFPMEELASESCHIGLLHIPKRSDKQPLEFGRDGPGDKNNKPLFRAEDIYYRAGDECLPAKGKHISFLSGPRPNPLLPSTSPFEGGASKKVILEHNLPDRNFICPHFVGRHTVLESLWAWLADQFSNVRVLAGEGGLGKTSIAYEFAKAVCVDGAAQFERVIWITAKKKQFSGIENTLLDVPETHFQTYRELLLTLGDAAGLLPDELDGSSEALLKRMLKEAFQITPALIIVDDVDSLDPNEQRRVLELGMILAGTLSRLLLTTRVNQSYSTDIALQVKGLEIIEYKEYVETLKRRFSTPPISDKQVERMHETTGGSPLFTESLIRLFRGYEVDRALKEWKGKLGEDARAAALRREVDHLTAEAKRAILALAYFGSSSFAELLEATGYGEEQLLRTVDELRSLFLVAAPQVNAEARFRILPNTQALVLSLKAQLATDHGRIEQSVRDLRKEGATSKLGKRNWIVGAAISQAIALLKIDKPEEARDAVKSALKSQKGNPDLLLMQARCLAAIDPPNHEEMRSLLRASYSGGCRRDILYELWYDAEWAVKHHSGALEAAEAALSSSAPDGNRWLLRKVSANWEIARAQEQSGNKGRALSDYWSCANDISKVMRNASSSDSDELREQKFRVHDAIWRVARRDTSSVTEAIGALDELHRMASLDDYRILTFLRMCEAIEILITDCRRERGNAGSGVSNLLEQQIRKVAERISEAVRRRPADSRLVHVQSKFSEATSAFIGIR